MNLVGSPPDRLLNAEIKHISDEYKLSYPKAQEIVADEFPGLVKAWSNDFENPSITELNNQEAAQSIVDKAQEIVDSEGISFTEAIQKVEKSHSDLYRKYNESLPNDHKSIALYILSEVVNAKIEAIQKENNISFDDAMEKMKELAPNLYNRYFNKEDDDNEFWETVFNVTQTIASLAELEVKESGVSFGSAVKQVLKSYPEFFEQIENNNDTGKAESLKSEINKLLKEIKKTKLTDGQLSFVCGGVPATIKCSVNPDGGLLVKLKDMPFPVKPNHPQYNDYVLNVLAEIVDNQVIELVEKGYSYQVAYEKIMKSKPEYKSLFKRTNYR